MALSTDDDQRITTSATIYASAHVAFVNEGGGFCAAVTVPAFGTPSVLLDRSLIGTPHEGETLRRVMLATAGGVGRTFFFVDD